MALRDDRAALNSTGLRLLAWLSPAEATALERELEATALAPDMWRVDSSEEFLGALREGSWDLLMVGAPVGEAGQPWEVLTSQPELPLLILAAPDARSSPGRLAATVVQAIRVAAERRQQPFVRVVKHVEEALARGAPLPETLTGVLELLCGWLPCARASVVEVDFRSERATVLAAVGAAADALPVGRQLTLQDIRLSGRYAAGEVDVVEDLGAMTAPSTTELELLRAGLVARVGAPIRSGDELLGVLFVASDRPCAFADAAVLLVQRAAAAVAVAMAANRRVSAADAVAGEARALARRLLAVQEGERGAVALRLHDEASQGVATMLLQIGLLERDPACPQPLRERLRGLKATADGVLASLHHTAVSLRPASLDRLGLVPALRHLAASVQGTYGLEVGLVSSELGAEPLPRASQLALFRVVEEALLNAARHARAGSVSITLQRRGDRLVVLVEDDGVGFAPSEERIPLGLLGMRERVAIMGGTLEIESAPGTGTVVHVEVPIGNTNSDR